jgi:hypothetical protein
MLKSVEMTDFSEAFPVASGPRLTINYTSLRQMKDPLVSVVARESPSVCHFTLMYFIAALESLGKCAHVTEMSRFLLS